MRALSSLLVLGLSLALWLAPGTGFAEESARELYERGTAQYALGKYAEAALLFERAFELKPNPAILYNTAQAHRLAGNKQRSLDLYLSYLRLYSDRVDRTTKVEVQRQVDNLRAAIAKDRETANSDPLTLKKAPPIAGPPETPPPSTPAATPPPTVVGAKPAPAPAPTAAPATSPAPSVTAPPPPPARRIKPWVWGVVGAGIVVVGAAVAVGVVFGTRGTQAPDATFGTARGN